MNPAVIALDLRLLDLDKKVANAQFYSDRSNGKLGGLTECLQEREEFRCAVRHIKQLIEEDTQWVL